MESLVSDRSRSGAGRRRVGLQPCPHCGGNVRLIRDVYGAYHQCMQCSREIDTAALAASAHEAPAIMVPGSRKDERLAA